ncbi:uncharacterized protein LOC135821109 [Sycon ciliatum]|uniref:uncharacterized protein LOC135821109 n=1 Tax=Sycon ciliatum TaxID=27933 RepID=UPI0031F5FAF2
MAEQTLDRELRYRASWKRSTNLHEMRAVPRVGGSRTILFVLSVLLLAMLCGVASSQSGPPSTSSSSATFTQSASPSANSSNVTTTAAVPTPSHMELTCHVTFKLIRLGFCSNNSSPPSPMIIGQIQKFALELKQLQGINITQLPTTNTTNYQTIPFEQEFTIVTQALDSIIGEIVQKIKIQPIKTKDLLCGILSSPENSSTPRAYVTLLLQIQQLLAVVTSITDTESCAETHPISLIFNCLLLQFPPQMNTSSVQPPPSDNNSLCLNLTCPAYMQETRIVGHIYPGVRNLSTQLQNAVKYLLPGCVNQSTIDRHRDALLLSILPCGLSCDTSQPGAFTAEQERHSRIVIQVFTWLSLLFTAFALVSFVINRENLNKYPTRIIVYINALYFLSSIVALVQVTGNEWRRYSCNEDNTVRTSEPRASDEGGTGEGRACAALFALNYFLLSSALLWWLCLTHAWYITFKAFDDQGLKERFRRYELVYHAFVWPTTLALMIGMLAWGKIDGVPIYGLCFTNEVAPWLYFMSLPVLVVGALGLPYLCLGTRMVLGFKGHIKKMARRSSIQSIERMKRNDSGLRTFLARTTLIIIVSFLHLLVQVAIAVYRLANDSHWKDEGEAYFLCVQTRCSSDASVCEGLKPNPSLELFTLISVLINMEGIVLTWWAFNAQTWREWKSRAGSTTSLFKRLSSHKFNSGDLSAAQRVMGSNTSGAAAATATSSSLSDSFVKRDMKTRENTKHNVELTRFRYAMSRDDFDHRYKRPNGSSSEDPSATAANSHVRDSVFSTPTDETSFTSIDGAGGAHVENGTPTPEQDDPRRDFKHANSRVHFSTTTDTSDVMITPPSSLPLAAAPKTSVAMATYISSTSSCDSPGAASSPSRSILKKGRSMSTSNQRPPPVAMVREEDDEQLETFQENIAAGANVPFLSENAPDAPTVMPLSRSPRISRVKEEATSLEAKRDSIRRRSKSASASLGANSLRSPLQLNGRTSPPRRIGFSDSDDGSDDDDEPDFRRRPTPSSPPRVGFSSSSGDYDDGKRAQHAPSMPTVKNGVVTSTPIKGPLAMNGFHRPCTDTNDVVASPIKADVAPWRSIQSEVEEAYAEQESKRRSQALVDSFADPVMASSPRRSIIVESNL